jgi:galactokinase/mevalonate kinase-like predicted kinase
LQPMLPGAGALLQWWESGIAQGTTLLKICGAGGGGYVLGFTTNPGEVLRMAEDIGTPVVFPFNASI